MFKKRNIRYVKLCVLGQINFTDDHTAIQVLDLNSQHAIASRIRDALPPDIVRVSQNDDAYTYIQYKLCENTPGLMEFLGPIISSHVKEVTVGYYHHRIIIIFSIPVKELNLPFLRKMRTDCLTKARNNIFIPISNPSNTSCPIKHIYSYCLILIPQGTKDNELESKRLADSGTDQVYSIRNTTYGLFIPDEKLWRQIVRWLRKPRQHYVRLSVPSAMVFLTGNSINKELEGAVLDAIYYGGLCRQMDEDNDAAVENKRDYYARDTWTHNTLFNVYHILVDSIRASEINAISAQLSRYSVFFAFAAVIAAAISILLIK